MNILYFGTVCDIKNYNEMLKSCRSKPSVSTIVFETALLDGFKKNGINAEIHSFPMIPTFPKFGKIFFGRKKEVLPCGYEATWLKTVNVTFLKQASRRADAKKALKRWGKENKGKGIVFTYSIPPFLVKDVVKLSKKYSLKSVAIIPDLLRDMYVNENAASLLTKLKNRYLAPALKLQGEYDGYIYLTEAMKDVVAPNKPYIVMEGIAAVDETSKFVPAEKAVPRAIMYAGMLHEKYGMVNLLDAFEQLTEKDVELWLFGDGTAVSEIIERAKENTRIKYFGSVERAKILEYEKKAYLLVNPRDPNEEFTAYSFPSKTIEYMLSGTPLLTTSLKGIPAEYFDYVFSVSDNSVESLASGMTEALSKTAEEMASIAKKASDFIHESKNSYCQTAKIKEFLEEVRREG